MSKLLILSFAFLAVGAHADEFSLHKQAAAAYYEGDRFYSSAEPKDHSSATQQTFEAAKAALRRSIPYWEQAIQVSDSAENIQKYQNNIKAAQEGISLAACLQHAYSYDLEELRDLVGKAKNPDRKNGFYRACLASPKLADYQTSVEKRIRLIEMAIKPTDDAIPKPQSSSGQATDVYAATTGCRSDQPGRGADKSCVERALDIKNGKYQFDLHPNCTEYGYRAVIATYDDAGTCTRQVVDFKDLKPTDSGYTNGSAIVKSSPSGPTPRLLDIILIKKGEADIVECYKTRHHGRGC